MIETTRLYQKHHWCRNANRISIFPSVLSEYVSESKLMSAWSNIRYRQGGGNWKSHAKLINKISAWDNIFSAQPHYIERAYGNMVCFESGILKISPVGSKRECGERNLALSNFTVFTQRLTTRLPHKLSLMKPWAGSGHTATSYRTGRFTLKKNKLPLHIHDFGHRIF